MFTVSWDEKAERFVFYTMVQAEPIFMSEGEVRAHLLRAGLSDAEVADRVGRLRAGDPSAMFTDDTDLGAWNVYQR